ncbi:MAG: hypothetical protein MUF72_17425 [Elainella sp. Prado103]|nr:hypothetical protein [Elainella sp. Prado103]
MLQIEQGSTSPIGPKIQFSHRSDYQPHLLAIEVLLGSMMPYGLSQSV